MCERFAPVRALCACVNEISNEIQKFKIKHRTAEILLLRYTMSEFYTSH
jgi:hypothetical protein